MTRVGGPDQDNRSIFDAFIVLGRVDATVLLIALGAFALADFSQVGSALRAGLIVLALAIVAVGVAVNGVRRANLMRRHRRAIDRIQAHIAEMDEIDDRDRQVKDG
ncbi:hypothetical protein [Palleronia sp.]|uniref:hypothetical protein n=1 Tax=Palleronia sp. TaxID=1940284 RepID=UPI0035C8145B